MHMMYRSWIEKILWLLPNYKLECTSKYNSQQWMDATHGCWWLMSLVDTANDGKHVAPLRVWSSDPNLYIPILLLQFRHYNTHCLYNVYTTHSTSILYYPIYYLPTSHLIVCCCINPPISHPHTTGGKGATTHSTRSLKPVCIYIYTQHYVYMTYILPVFGIILPYTGETKKLYHLHTTHLAFSDIFHCQLSPLSIASCAGWPEMVVVSWEDQIFGANVQYMGETLLDVLWPQELFFHHPKSTQLIW